MNKWGGYLLVLAIALAIGTGGVMVENYLDGTAEELSARLRAVAEALERQDWREGERAFYGFERRWRVVRRNWALVIDHTEIDAVDVGLARLKELLRSREDEDALAEYGEVLMLLEHIPERERLTWRNLF